MLFWRGDIVLADFTPAKAGEANYIRPAVIITNNQANALAPVIVVVPLTSNVERIYPMQLFIASERSGLDRDSKAQVELLRHISVERVRKVLSHLPDDLMRELDQRIREHLAL
jgi:mRNA interferase MazF